MDELRHIVIIAELFPPDTGGGSTRASNVVKGLVKQGCMHSSGRFRSWQYQNMDAIVKDAIEVAEKINNVS